jgi:hypothetical protein
VLEPNQYSELDKIYVEAGSLKADSGVDYFVFLRLLRQSLSSYLLYKKMKNERQALLICLINVMRKNGT